MPENYDVICLGLIVADHICAPIKRFPPQGAIISTDRLELAVGGSAANLSVDLAKLGVSVMLSGRVGNDIFGRYVCEHLEESGVDCQHVVRTETSQTASTMVVNVAGEDRRFIHAVGANVELTGAEVTDDMLDRAQVLAVGGFGLNPALSGANVADLFRRARARNVFTILDVVILDQSNMMEMVAEVLPETDLFVPNNDEAAALTGLTDPHQQAEHFLQAGCGAVIITQGPRGALLCRQDGVRVLQPAFAVEQIDGTGSGDAFLAGYIYGILQSAEPARCLAYGSAMGASCVQAPGATTGVFNAQQIEDFLEQQK